MIWKTQAPNKDGFYLLNSFRKGKSEKTVLFVDKEKIHQIKKCLKKGTDAQIWERAIGGKIDVDFWCEIDDPRAPFDPCTHPVEKLTRKYSSNAGNYDPSADIYMVDVYCECGKSWYASTRSSYYEDKDEYEEYRRLGMINCKEKERE